MSTTHRWLSLFEGCLLVALGVHLLNAANLLISGTAGIGMILTQLTPLSFGQLFFLLNLPFYLLAWNTLGMDFTVRTFFSISMLAGLSELMRLFIHIDIDPLFSALLGGNAGWFWPDSAVSSQCVTRWPEYSCALSGATSGGSCQ